jgi:hypothetical protein
MAAPEFRLEQHLECVELPQAETKDELLDEVGRQFSRKLDPNQPRWRAVVLHGRPTRDSEPAPATPACILFLLHHAYADGIRALGLVETLGGGGPDPVPSSEADSGPRRYRRSATRLGKFWQGIKAVGKM